MKVGDKVVLIKPESNHYAAYELMIKLGFKNPIRSNFIRGFEKETFTVFVVDECGKRVGIVTTEGREFLFPFNGVEVIETSSNKKETGMKKFKLGTKVVLTEQSGFKPQMGNASYGLVTITDAGDGWVHVKWQGKLSPVAYNTAWLEPYAPTKNTTMKVFKSKTITIKGLERDVMVAVLVVDGLIRAGYAVRMLEDGVVEGRSEHIAMGRAMNDRTNLLDMELGRGMDKKYILHAIADDLLKRIEHGSVEIKGIKVPKK